MAANTKFLDYLRTMLGSKFPDGFDGEDGSLAIVFDEGPEIRLTADNDEGLIVSATLVGLPDDAERANPILARLLEFNNPVQAGARAGYRYTLAHDIAYQTMTIVFRDLDPAACLQALKDFAREAGFVILELRRLEAGREVQSEPSTSDALPQAMAAAQWIKA